MKRWWVGLTGGIGSGKSTVAAAFKTLGVPLINADVIGAQLTKPQQVGFVAIKNEWGQRFISDNGELDRAKLLQVVFSDSAVKQRLEALLHPLIFQEIQTTMATTSSSSTYGIIEIPLLAEHPTFCALVQRVLVVSASADIRRERIKARSGWDDAQIDAVMQQQASEEARAAIADDILINHQGQCEIEQQVFKLHQSYCRMKSTPHD